MQKNNNFLMQASILAAAGLFTRILGFLYRIPMQNWLGDAGTGVYGMAYSIYLLLLVVSSAGLPAAISRMVSQRVALKAYANARKVLDVALIVAGISGFVAMAGLFLGTFVWVQWLPSEQIIYSLRALAPTVFLVAIMSVYRGYFQGLGNAVPTAISQVVEQVINAVFSVVLVYILIDEGIAIASAGGQAASGLGAVFGLLFIVGVYWLQRPRDRRRIAKYAAYERPESRRSIAKELIFTAMPIIAGTAVFSITGIIDLYMVVHLLEGIGFSEMEAMILYGQLNGKYIVITTLPVAIATAIAVALIPSITRSVTLDELDETKEKINMAFRMAMLICVPAAMGIGVMAHQILLFLFPNSPDGGILLQVGAFSVMVLGLTQVATGILQGLSILKVPVMAALIGSLVKIGVNFVLIPIPEINVVGAVVGTTVCYVIAAGINTYTICKATGVKLDHGGIWIKPCLSAGVMGLVCYISYFMAYLAFPSNGISLIFAIITSVITYFGCMIYLRGLTSRELALLPMGKKLMRMLDKVGIDYV